MIRDVLGLRNTDLRKIHSFSSRDCESVNKSPITTQCNKCRCGQRKGSQPGGVGGERVGFQEEDSLQQNPERGVGVRENEK